jgi:hypothetical protein
VHIVDDLSGCRREKVADGVALHELDIRGEALEELGSRGRRLQRSGGETTILELHQMCAETVGIEQQPLESVRAAGAAANSTPRL